MNRRVSLACLVALLALLSPSAGVRADEAAPAPAAEAGQAATGARVARISFAGVTKLPEAKLLELMQTRPGESLDPEILEQDLRRIEAYYHQNGFPLAYVAAGAGIDGDGVVTIPVEEGRIEKLTVSGARRTRRSVILRELGLRPGDVYDTRALTADRQRLYRLGFFNRVAFEPKPGSEPGKAVLNVDVSERQTGAISGMMGYASTSGFVGYFELSDINFLGTGQTVYLNWQRGLYTTVDYLSGGGATSRIEARSGFDLGYYTPWLLHRRLSAGLRYFDAPSQQFSYFGQDFDADNVKNYEWRRGIWGVFQADLGGDTSLGFLIRRENVDFSLAPPEVAPPPGVSILPARISSIRLSLGRGSSRSLGVLDDTPKTGVYVELGHSDSADLSGLYQKYGVVSTQYLKLTRRDTLATRAQVGWSTGKLPFAESFTVGGAQTLRSYTVGRFPGTRMVALNTEIRHELRTGLAAALFLDLGYAWPQGTRWSLSDMRSAIGLGFRVATPFGPLRLDYAYGRDGGRFLVTTGDLF